MSRQYHVCLGTPSYHLDGLRLDAERGETVWTINRRARAGDGALFYMARPVSAIVATGTLVKDPAPCLDPESSWHGRAMAEIAELEMHDPFITLRELKDRIPEWVYWKSPVLSHPVPPQFARRLEYLLRAAA